KSRICDGRFVEDHGFPEYSKTDRDPPSGMIRLSRAQVNSWRLSKNHLAQRVPRRDMSQVVSDVCGVQAQVLSGAALSLWARVNSGGLSKSRLPHRVARRDMSQAVSHVCGVQAQILSGAALSLWARVNSITIQDVEDALWKHWILVKTWAMRGTLHLLSSNSLSTYVAALKTSQDLHHEKISYRIGPGPADKKYQITRAEQEQVTKAIYDALDGHVLTRE